MCKRLSFITLLIAVTLCSAAIAQERTEDVIRVDTSLVNIPVIVSDRDNRYIPGLQQSNFRIRQDGVEQKIEIFSNDDAPMNIVLALDTSRSTQQVLGKIKKAAKQFIKSLDPGDRCMIVTFDYQVNVLSDLTSDHKLLEKAINHAEVGDVVGTLLQDAVYGAINRQLRDIKGRKAIILLTDGKDHGSLVRKNDLLDDVTESDTVIYPIFYETGNNPRQFRRDRPIRNRDIFGGGVFGRGGRRGGMGRMPGRFPRDPFPDMRFPRDRGNNPARQARVEENNEAAISFLERLAELTGGYFYKEQGSDLKDAFAKIADQMKRQYLLGFYPIAESAPGSVHKIRVEVDRDGVAVRAKGAYRTRSR